MIEKAGTCPHCGTRYDDWDPAKGGDVHAYYPKVQVCLGCKARHDAWDVERDRAKESNAEMPEGIQIHLERNPTAPPLRPIMQRKTT